MLKGIDNIVILSGGSGNDAILQALFDMGYTDKNIRIIVNAYDDGKSTGICREVTGTLGVSDIRKNHSKIHKMLHEEPNEFLMDLYDNRIHIDNNYRTGNQLFDILIRTFLNNIKTEDSYDNFNVMNIVYSQLYANRGYEISNKIMSDILDIDDVVKLNSFDNVKIIASTKNNNIILDEGDIVEWKNSDDPIKDIHFVGKRLYGLNEEAKTLISEADLIIISTGTFWSSIYPTLKYCDFYKYINESTANKLWIMNSGQDKDAYGVSSMDFIYRLNKLGFIVDYFDIILNKDADDILKKYDDTINPYMWSLGNDNGKNDPIKIREALETIYG